MTQEHDAETANFTIKMLKYGGREITTTQGKFLLQADHPHDHLRETIVWTPMDEEGSDGIMLDSLNEAMGYVRGFSAAMPLREVTGWQPIETAPHGVEVMVVKAGTHPFTGKPYIPITAYYEPHIWTDHMDRICDDYDPTHWMPLPTPPEVV